MAGNLTKIKDGYYRLRYRDYSRYVTAKTDRKAERLLAAFVAEIDSGDFTMPTRVTFKQFAEKFLEGYAEVELEPKTVFRYRQLLESRIYPAIGHKRLNTVKPLDLVTLYNKMREPHKYIGKLKDGTRIEKKAGPLSSQTIKHHHRLIHAIFEKAIQWDALKGANPASRVDAPKVAKKKAACYDADQMEALLKALDNVGENELKYKVATMIALMTGARLGEIMGLEWRDIYFDEKYIEIGRTSQYLPNKGTFTKAPKNESSVRRVSVNAALLTLLKDYQENQRTKGFICQGNNRLFVTWDGRPMHPNSVSHWFPDFLDDNNLTHLNFHGLRHTSATFLISRGVDIQTVAGRLGHSTSATTQNIYSHFLESRDRQAADMMEAELFKNKVKGRKKNKSV